MAKFQPGQSGNPAGRPPKSRALSDTLEKALAKTVQTEDGNISGKRLLAMLVVQAVTTGKVHFPGEESASVLGVKDWMEFVKWAYQYLEPPITRSEVAADVKAEVTVKDGTILSKLLPELATSGAEKSPGEPQ